MNTPVYLATILLEKNRWNGKGPSLLVSEWMEPIAEAGFAGVEIWMNHLLLSSRSEWELIKNKARDLDLPIAIINSYVPTDGSEKSRRLRDQVNEACEYFLPDGLKINIGDRTHSQASESEFLEALEFVKEWSIQVPREMVMLMENHAKTFTDDLDAAIKARVFLGESKFKCILHPFSMEPEELESVLGRWGNAVTHFHVQNSKEGQRALLVENKELVLQCLAVIKAKKYKGTWSLEFTKGTGKPGEDIDQMFDYAEKDLNFLHAALAKEGLA